MNSDSIFPSPLLSTEFEIVTNDSFADKSAAKIVSSSIVV
jgi:hypothetical protein